MSETLPDNETPVGRMSRKQLEAEVARMRSEHIDRLEYLRTLHDLGTYREEVVAQNAQLEEAQKELESACSRYADLFDFAPISYVTLNRSGMIADINLTGASLIGIERARLMGTPFVLQIDSGTRHQFLEHLRRCRETRITHAVEVRLHTRERGSIPVLLSTHSAGAEFRMTITDLSERKHAERRLQEQLELLGLALGTAQGGAWRYELRTRRLQWTPEHFDLFGLPRTDFIGVRDWLRAVHPEDRDDLEQAFERLHFHGGDFECEYRGGPGARNFLTRCRVLDADENSYVGITLNITDARRNEDALRSLNRALGDRTLQLETTMQRLQRMAAELAQTEQRERQSLAHLLHDHLQQLLVAARYKTSSDTSKRDENWLRAALQVIDELLAEAIRASRTLTVELSPPVLNDADLEQSLAWLARWMEEKHSLSVELRAAPMPDQSEQHKWMLFQLARELLFNVVKHSGVTQAVLAVDKHNCEWRIIVEDKGFGFDTRQLEAGASGFGLFGMRQRLSAYGGHLAVQSHPGEGCRVEVSIPIDAALPAPLAIATNGNSLAMAELTESTSGGPRRIRVLLADDHDILRSSLASLLRSEGDIEVVGEARDGVSAVQLTEMLEPDVVLMDVTMPEMNGIEATRRVMQERPNTRVVALSMHSADDLSASMREAGAVEFISKSAPIAELLEAIREPAG